MYHKTFLITFTFLQPTQLRCDLLGMRMGNNIQYNLTVCQWIYSVAIYQVLKLQYNSFRALYLFLLLSSKSDVLQLYRLQQINGCALTFFVHVWLQGKQVFNTIPQVRIRSQCISRSIVKQFIKYWYKHISFYCITMCFMSHKWFYSFDRLLIQCNN